MNLRRQAGPAVAIVVCLAALVVLGLSQNSLRADGVGEKKSSSTQATATDDKRSLEGLSYQRVSNPAGTKVVDESGKVVAQLTDTARTAVITGPKRTFEEPGNTKATVTTDKWVRLLPKPWEQGAEDADWFQQWFADALNDRSPDALEIGTQYFEGAKSRYDEKGLRYAGDADFGPMKKDGSGVRAVGGDFNDFLEIKVSFPDDSVDRPEEKQKNALDCSGFLRIVYGYRMGYPMYGGNPKGEGLQRQVEGMHENGPGVMLVNDTGQPPSLSVTKKFLPGDILFFSTDGKPGLDHSGIYMGKDSQGHHRFMSSRDTVNGPTMGDVAGPSIIDGTGLFANNWRAARRI